MHSDPCESLRRQGYQFFSPHSSAAVKPCLWCIRALKGGEMCYKHQFYGIESHRCVQMTPTLKCNQRCLFCWRSFEHEVEEETECTPEEILAGVARLQLKGLAGYKVSPDVTAERFDQAIHPKHIAISLAGEPTGYSRLPELVDLFSAEQYTTFLVSNGTRPWVLRKCKPYQLYISLDAPNEAIYRKLCQPRGDYWELVQESLSLLGSRRSAIRITLVAGINDTDPAGFAAMIADAAPTYVEVKGYMYLGSSRNRLQQGHMPDHQKVRGFAEQIGRYAGYTIKDEHPGSRVVCMERADEI